MKITRHIVKVKDLVEGYVDSGNEGVEGYGGRLDIRPAYQREFIYSDDKQQAVVDSVMNGFPLGIMYWVDHEDGTYEVLDGQQRTLSICKYYNHEFSITGSSNKTMYYDSLTKEEEEHFMDYELDVYVCRGDERDKLDWFERINVQGEPLTKQELRNASYTGPWLSSAKSYFSKNGAPVDDFRQYMSGKKNRQDWLETAIEWKSQEDFGTVDVDKYMSKHQKDDDAKELWQYYFRVMKWVEAIFTKYRSQMKGIGWGLLYSKHKEQVLTLEPDKVEELVSDLMKHPDIKSKKGIYEYIFDGDEQHLNLRGFDDKVKAEVYEEQDGKCNMCGEEFELPEMHADHIVPFSKGGLTEKENCQMLCAKDNWAKAGR